jgi:hypothetical protein
LYGVEGIAGVGSGIAGVGSGIADIGSGVGSCVISVNALGAVLLIFPVVSSCCHEGEGVFETDMPYFKPC